MSAAGDEPRVEEHGAIFDMDGVLVDSSAAHYESWRQLGEEEATPFPRHLFDQTFGMHNSQIIPMWLGDIAPVEVERLSLRKEELYRLSAPRVLRALPGAVDLVLCLHADGFRLAVASSGPRANVKLCVELLDLQNAFHLFVTGDDVTHGKPHPEVFLKAAIGLGIPTEQCVVIEDSPQGIEAGRAAGATVVAVTSTRPQSELHGAHRVVASLDELSPADLRTMIDAAGKSHVGERGSA